MEERIEVEFRYPGFASYTDLAPLLDELRNSFAIVNTWVRTPLPSDAEKGGAFGPSLDLVFDLARYVSEHAVDAVMAILVSEGFKKARSEIIKLREKDQRLDYSNFSFNVRQKPLTITVGNFWFYHNDPLTKEEFLHSLKAAQALVATLPERQKTSLEAGREWPRTWDASSQKWSDPQSP